MENNKKEMTHDDWLYLIEFFMKRNDSETAENIAKAMKWKEPASIEQARQRIRDAGVTPYYL